VLFSSAFATFLNNITYDFVIFFILMLYRYVQQILPEFSHNWLTMVGGLGKCGHSEETSTHKHKYT